MPDGNGYTGDPDEIKAVATKFATHADTFQNHTGLLEGFKAEYAVAVQGQTGNAIQEAFQGALDKGAKLHQTFREIVDTLADSSNKFSAQDLENAAAVKNKYNLNF
ncbi:WXG100 family type VII secretion target [Nocardia beijingensis]|uniref:WXG100 family type VII secretion target n=1 Tax=Nocardia beijingensis TaxID=95162 RepID=A0ABW7WK53_9NOCA